MNNIAIIGSGGHAKIIVDILNELNTYNIIGFYDDNIKSQLYDLNHLGKTDKIDKSINYFIIAIGNNNIRKQIYDKNKDLSYPNLIHPKSIISKNSKLGIGNVICAGAVIQTDVIIGNHCIINTNSSIDHESIIKDYCSVCPGVVICGNVKIDELTFIGANSTIIQCLTIGNNCIIGSASNIIKNVDNNNKIVGNPSRIL